MRPTLLLILTSVLLCFACNDEEDGYGKVNTVTFKADQTTVYNLDFATSIGYGEGSAGEDMDLVIIDQEGDKKLIVNFTELNHKLVSGAEFITARDSFFSYTFTATGHSGNMFYFGVNNSISNFGEFTDVPCKLQVSAFERELRADGSFRIIKLIAKATFPVRYLDPTSSTTTTATSQGALLINIAQ